MEELRQGLYAPDYKDGRWISLKHQVFERDGFACVICGSQDGLQCHHHWYVGGRKIWEYSPDELSSLCEAHHELITKAQREFRQSLYKIPPAKFIDVCKTILEPPRSVEAVGGIRITATNDETVAFRLHRLRKLVCRLLEMPCEAFRLVESLHDDKGTLCVSWKLFSTKAHREELRQAWRECNECDIRHFETSKEAS